MDSALPDNGIKTCQIGKGEVWLRGLDKKAIGAVLRGLEGKKAGATASARRILRGCSVGIRLRRIGSTIMRARACVTVSCNAVING